MERLQKKIAQAGFCSRRKAEELIKQGRVKVNNETIKTLGFKVSEKDQIQVDNKLLSKEEKEYYLLYKPAGVISTATDEKNRQTVVDLINTTKRIYPVGRLDYDTTGALILTNDGDFTNLLTHPKNNISKTYYAKIKGHLSKNEIEQLKTGIVIDDQKTYPAHLKITKKNNEHTWLRLTIHEGRNHQIKKMFLALNKEVISLKREKIEFLDLQDLRTGEYRTLKPKEIKKFYGLKK